MPNSLEPFDPRFDEKEDAIAIAFSNLPKEFIAQSNHQSPYRIEGVAKARLVKEGKTQGLLVYSVYGQLQGLNIDNETYTYVRQLFHQLSNLPIPQVIENAVGLNDTELRLNRGLHTLQNRLRDLRRELFVNPLASPDGALFELAATIDSLLLGNDV